MDNQLAGTDTFLEMIHELEHKIVQLIFKSDLSEDEKCLILKHIIVVPGSED